MVCNTINAWWLVGAVREPPLLSHPPSEIEGFYYKQIPRLRYALLGMTDPQIIFNRALVSLKILCPKLLTLFFGEQS